MAKLTTHWTERSVDDYLYRIASDFLLHIEKVLSQRRMSQSALANRLGVSKGRISQVLNNPGNMTLKQIIKYARSIGEKVSIVAYNDNDPENVNGPVRAEIFLTAWIRAGKPTDFFVLNEHNTATTVSRLIQARDFHPYQDDRTQALTDKKDDRISLH